MAIFDRFRRKEPAKPAGQSVASTIQQTLAANGIDVTTDDVQEVLDNVGGLLQYKLELPEAMHESESAELECTGPGFYTVHVSWSLTDFPIDLVDDTPTGLVLGGIPADARIIVAGQELVKEGDVVKPVEADQATIQKLLGEVAGTQ